VADRAGASPTSLRLLAEAVVTVDLSGRVHRPGVVDIEGERIAWVGPAAGAPATGGTVEDVGGLLMPGLVNAHGHTPMTLLRGAGDGLPLDRWLHEVVFPQEAALEDDDVYWGMLLGAAEQLACGVTTTAEMYFFGRALAAAALEAGIRCALAPAILDVPDGPPAMRWRHFLEEAGELHADLHGREGRLTVGLGPHSAYLLPDDALAATAEVARESGVLVQIHVAETAAEGRRLAAERGVGAPELLARLGMFDGPVVAAHSVWLSGSDLDLYRRHGVAVAHCPQSNGKLGSGVAPLPALLALGIPVGLGTDGPASNDNLDLWEELRLAPLLARATAADPSVVPTATALRLATRGGAEALALETGSLEAGRPADVIRLDLDSTRLTPALDDGQLLAHLVWATSSAAVTDVWVGGRRVVRAGRCTTVDARGARAEVTRRARRLREAAAG
jgi:5-methylthioadenosine/S-adenosylhomocysteine deaminase